MLVARTAARSLSPALVFFSILPLKKLLTMLFGIAALFVGAGLTFAQSISSGCKTTLLSLVASPDAACLDPSALLSLATQSSNSSIIDPVNNWLQGLCPLAPCTNSSLSAIVTNITSGCSSDLSSLGLTTSDPSGLISAVQAGYPVVRQVICLKDTKANELCVTELLTDIQDSVGTLSLANLMQIVPNIISGSSNIPQNVTCSDCVKQSLNIINKGYPGLIPDSVSGNLSSTCGSNFTDGTTPSDISESASTAAAGSAASSNGAASFFSANSIVAVAVSTIVVVSSAVVVFA